MSARALALLLGKQIRPGIGSRSGPDRPADIAGQPSAAQKDFPFAQRRHPVPYRPTRLYVSDDQPRWAAAVRLGAFIICRSTWPACPPTGRHRLPPRNHLPRPPPPTSPIRKSSSSSQTPPPTMKPYAPLLLRGAGGDEPLHHLRVALGDRDGEDGAPALPGSTWGEGEKRAYGPYYWDGRDGAC
jgi:hypothetical protein